MGNHPSVGTCGDIMVMIILHTNNDSLVGGLEHEFYFSIFIYIYILGIFHHPN